MISGEPPVTVNRLVQHWKLHQYSRKHPKIDVDRVEIDLPALKAVQDHHYKKGKEPGGADPERRTLQPLV